MWIDGCRVMSGKCGDSGIRPKNFVYCLHVFFVKPWVYMEMASLVTYTPFCLCLERLSVPSP